MRPVLWTLLACGWGEPDAPPTPPTPPVGTPLRAEAVHGGGDWTCAHLEDGRIACWGAGDGRKLGREVPAACSVEIGRGVTVPYPCDPEPDVLPALEEVDAVDLGGAHGCALKEGEAWCWGLGVRRVLGFEPQDRCPGLFPGQQETACQQVPRRVPDLPPVVEVSAGTTHSCARTDDGRVFCWGAEALGSKPPDGCPDFDGVLRDCSGPVEVPGLPPASRVVAGVENSCAITRDGEVWCWGANELGRLGDGTAQDRLTPVKLALPGPATALDLGSSNGCAIVAGVPWCWGSSWHRETGTPGSEACPARMGSRDLGFPVACEPAPVAVPGVTGASDLRVAGSFVCVTVDGGPVCWGASAFGLPEAGAPPRPVAAPPLHALGQDYGCGLVDGVVHCLGTNPLGAHGGTGPLTEPTPVTW